MGVIFRLALGTAVLATALVTMTARPELASAAATHDVPGAELRTGQPVYGQDEPIRLTFTVTNDSGAECGLTDVAVGAVQVISVRRDGVELVPSLGRSFYPDGIGAEIAAGLVPVAQGSTVDVLVTSVRVAGGTDSGSAVLRSVTPTSSGGGLDTLWPIGAPGEYVLTATYAIPPVQGGVVPCTGVAAAATVTFTVVTGSRTDDGTGWPVWLWLAAGVLGVLAVGVLVVVLVLRRRRAPAAAVLLVLAATVAVGAGAEPAQATYEIDADSGIPVPGVDFRAAVLNCFATFDAPGGDPAGVMNRLRDPESPPVRIIPTDGGSNTFETPESAGGLGSSTITWNPTSTAPYGDGVARDPCAALYHELVHGDDISRDQVPEGDCGSTGIRTAEVRATLAENEYRRSRGLPPRTEYDGHRLPESLDECNEAPAPREPERGPRRLCEDSADCASTNGDPHLVTFDRTYYDFQAVGEFVLVRSTAGEPLEIQARQAPFGPTRAVSVNSAVAFRLGDDTVSLTLVDGATQVHINGERVRPAPGDTPLPDGGQLSLRASDTSSADGFDIGWPDGSGAAVDQIGGYGYRVLVKLDQSRAGAVEGLLGDYDGDPSNDVAPQSGPPLDQPVQFDDLYPSFADSWRITPEASLFNYADGESTDTFTDRAYPDRPLTMDDLDADARSHAERICRAAGVSDPWLLNECIFDVAATGRSDFAVSVAGTELVAPPAAAPIAATPIAEGALAPGGDERLTFPGRAGDAVFVDIVAPTLPSRCSPSRLLDPVGAVIGSGCLTNGSGIIDRTELTVDGEYTVLVEGEVGDTGKAMVRVYAVGDTNATIDPNGVSVTAVLDQPGSVASYRFSGRAGERVYLDVFATTLPSQCSPLGLLDPEGREIDSGCLVGGHGAVDGTVLPADGTYTIEVDPSSRTIGAVDMRLYAARDTVASIAIDGPPVVATIEQPGAVVRYEFTATAGTSVTLTATEATLRSECSPLDLLVDDDRTVASGCILNGEGGIDAIVLPATGRYTIMVDPGGTATGSVTLSLTTSQ